jgi:hypothetical protein
MKRLCRSAALALAFAVLTPSLCRASANDNETLDAAGLQQLEQRAAHAEAREQAYLYTELVQLYTRVAGQQMSAGDMVQANATLKRIQHLASLIHDVLAKNAHKLKDAEMMMHMATYRLGQCMHLAPGEDQPAVATTIHQLDKVHDELLSQVFSR